jgi:hypothetical protein
MRTIRIVIIALAIGAGVALGALPAVAATAHATGAFAMAPLTCPPRDTPGFCAGG